MCSHYVIGLYLSTWSLQTLAIEHLGVFILFEPLHHTWNSRLKLTFTAKILRCKDFDRYLSIHISRDIGVPLSQANKRYKAVEKLTTWLSVRSQLSRTVRAKRQSRESDEILNSSDERAFLLPQSLPAVVRFDQCREPLVEA